LGSLGLTGPVLCLFVKKFPHQMAASGEDGDPQWVGYTRRGVWHILIERVVHKLQGFRE